MCIFYESITDVVIITDRLLKRNYPDAIVFFNTLSFSNPTIIISRDFLWVCAS